MENYKILKHNLELFKARFPELVKLLRLNSEKQIKDFYAKVPETYQLVLCKKKAVYTLSIDGKFIHSKYDAVRQANEILKESLFENIEAQKVCAFFGLGLGYVPENFMLNFPQADVIIVEPDLFVFFKFLQSRNLDSFFSHKKLTLLIGLTANEVLNFLLLKEAENTELQETPKFFLRAIEFAQPAWYAEYKTIFQRTNSRKQTNANTVKKFFALWFKNLVKNFFFSKENPRLFYSLKPLEKKFEKYPVLIFAGGVSLEKDLAELANEDLSGVLVLAVDTVAKAVIKAGIVPDFVVTGDPQYFNFKHLQNTDLQKSFLVAEAATFPQTLRLKTRGTFIFSQDLPAEKAFFSELKKVEPKFLEPEFSITSLRSGGSVATTAFSLAKFLGARKIYFSGLDLGYTEKRTHFKGAAFETESRRNSLLILPIQTQMLNSLYNTKTFPAKNNSGSEILTDARMQMYGWWFESEIANEQSDLEVFTFSKKGFFIPGINLENIQKAVDDFKKSQTKTVDLSFVNKPEKTISPKAIIQAAETLIKNLLNIDTIFRELAIADKDWFFCLTQSLLVFIKNISKN